jgi:Ca2+-binding EF-hand superfamily protein
MQRSWCVGAFAAVVAVSVLGSATQAADPAKKAPDPAKVFSKKDANGDGSLSLDEFKTGLKDKALENADKRFKKMDSNADSKLSLDEFKSGMQPKK